MSRIRVKEIVLCAHENEVHNVVLQAPRIRKPFSAVMRPRRIPNYIQLNRMTYGPDVRIAVFRMRFRERRNERDFAFARETHRGCRVSVSLH